MTIYQARANLYFVLSDFKSARAEGERLLALARQAGDRGREARALAGMGMASARGHDFDRGLAEAHQAIAIAREIEARPVLASGYFTIGLVHAVTDHLDAAREEIDLAITISRSGSDVVHQSFALTYAGQLKNWRGEYAEALPLQAEALRIAREHTLLVPLLSGFFNSGLALVGKGDYDEALARFEEGLVLSEKVGNDIYRHRLLNSLGWLAIECGDLERAIDLNRQGAEGARKRDDHETIANAELNLGDIFLAQGDLTLAQEFLDGVYHLVHHPATSDWMKWRYSMHLFASLGDFWLARGEPARAQEFADQCLDIATRTNSRKYIVKGWRLQGEIALRPPPVGRGRGVAAPGPAAGPGGRQPDAALEDPPRPGTPPRRSQTTGAGPAGVPGRPCGHRAGQGERAEPRAPRQPGAFTAAPAGLWAEYVCLVEVRKASVW